jgi:hypothetical protein
MRLRLLDPTPDPEHLALVLDPGPGCGAAGPRRRRPRSRARQEAQDLGLVVSEVVPTPSPRLDAPDAIILLSVLAAGDALS